MVVEFYRRLLGLFGRMSTGATIALVVGLTIVTSVFGVLVVVFLPADHFSAAARGRRPPRHPVLLWTVRIVKNALGYVILPLGVVMALPLVPGPGVVLILVGLSLIDFPGKRNFERKVIARPSVLRTLNDMRTRFGRAPLVID